MQNKKWSFTLCSMLVIVALGAFGNSANASGPHFSVIHLFTGGSNDGLIVAGGLTADKAGNLYGVTYAGGAGGHGTVYEFSPPASAGGAWSETILHSFNGADGDVAAGAPVMDSKGNIYGVTSRGGANNQGLVYELVHNLDGSWSENILHTFTGFGDGGQPYGLVLDSSGNVYGVAGIGGGSLTCSDCGAVFELKPAAGGWNYQLLYSFEHNANGYSPVTLVIRGGKLYGTTDFSQARNGTVFELAHQNGTWNFSLLYSFQGGTDGVGTRTPLIFDAAGNIYGIDGSGINNLGQIFELTPSTSGQPWNKNTLYDFASKTDGYSPSSLTINKSGHLFGTTSFGGGGVACPKTSGCGEIFELVNQNGSWTKTTLYSVTGQVKEPFGATFGLNGALFGALYGTKANNSFGAIFKLGGVTP